jgi:uncharacterized repeat protein (TIGR03843 family)
MEGQIARNAASQLTQKVTSVQRRMATNIDLVEALQEGKLKIEGEFQWGSNYTFLVKIETQNGLMTAVYKPTRGERPLWDFPAASLAKREVVAYWVDQALGWELVPPTVYRSRGPVGPGSLQAYIEHDPNYHYFTFSEEDTERLRPTAVFDLLINNADRKGSHVLVDADRHIWLIDHGVCFHVEDKLRTVIWNFVGEIIPEPLLSDLARFRRLLAPVEGSPSELFTLLSRFINRDEIAALDTRASQLINTRTFPAPDPNRRPYPWPAI